MSARLLARAAFEICTIAALIIAVASCRSMCQ